MKEFLKLIRWQNLLIIIITMILMRYAIIESLINRIGVLMLPGTGVEVPMMLQFEWYNFVILIIATVCITAGGYVINDYFDIKTDLINRGKVLVGTKVSRRKAIMWHSVFNVIGVAAGFYVSWKAHYFWFGTIFLIVSGLLYFYSASYKRQFLIGNLIVAVLTAAVPLLVVLFEWAALYRFYVVNVAVMPELDFLFGWVGGFAIYAFLTTLVREIIKDIEDFEGDMAYGRNTIPVITGIRASKIITASLAVLTIASLYFVWFYFLNDRITLIYLTLFIVIPYIYALYLLFSAGNKRDIHRASNLMKMIMLAGIFYAIVVKAILSWNLIS
ncbi:MAG: UbiA family prenyltransferase [Bacteroidetes bacterium]|nr:UbiA family prenyltransferase [Bacteroidota bacterium]